MKPFSHICNYYYNLTFYLINLCLSLLKSVIGSPVRAFKVIERQYPPLKCAKISYDVTHSFVKLHGIKLHYVTQGDDSNPVLLCLHGFAEFWYSWRYQLDYFSKNYKVVCLDLPGYGDSENHQFVSMNFMIGIVGDFIISLKKRDCVLMGHDLGGLIGWSVAHRYSDLISKVVILSAPHPSVITTEFLQQCCRMRTFDFIWCYYGSQCESLWTYWCMLKDIQFFDLSLGTSNVDIDDIEYYKFIYSRRCDWTAAIRTYKSLLATLPQIALGETLDLPVLLLFGEEDHYFKVPWYYKSQFYGNNVKIESILEAGHYIQQDKPKKLNKLLDAFLGGQVKKSQQSEPHSSLWSVKDQVKNMMSKFRS